MKTRKIIKEALANEIALQRLYEQKQSPEDPELARFFAENAKLSGERVQELRRLFQKYCGG